MQRHWLLCRLPEDEARFYAAEVVITLEHLHGLSIVYRDLKARLTMSLFQALRWTNVPARRSKHDASGCTGFTPVGCHKRCHQALICRKSA